MSTVVTNNVADVIEFTRNGATVFSGLLGPSTTLLGVRVAIGFGEISGIAMVTASVPGAGTGTLTIEQSVDGVNWDWIDSYVLSLLVPQPFAIKILARFVRAQYALLAGVAQDLRFGAQLKPITSP